jgi:zinc transporter 10
MVYTILGQFHNFSFIVSQFSQFHNFSDGIAIGASFASSLTTGFGTSIAVLFHELPHEIGDFAVLRKNGVSVKRAVLFNILSSLLCFIGVFFGLFIGSIEILSQFTFLFIAGTFIYISLVNIVR